MPYLNERNRAGREPCLTCNLTLDKCANNYASGLCTATQAISNLLTYSEQIDHADWVKQGVSIAANDTTAPDGNATADKSTGDGINTFPGQRQTLTVAWPISQQFVASVYVKENVTVPHLTHHVRDLDNSLNIYIVHTWVAGVPTFSSKVEQAGTIDDYGVVDEGDGWYRVWMKCTMGQATTSIQFSSFIGWTVATTGSVWIWGNQLPEGNVLLPYYATTTTGHNGTPGTECFNTRETCQDIPNFNNTDTLIHKFSDREIPGADYIDCINNSKLLSVAITPGQPFNKRASITIQLQDFPHHDRGIDPYILNRTYAPQGTYFGKMLARNPFYQGRALELGTGYLTGETVDNGMLHSRAFDNAAWLLSGAPTTTQDQTGIFGDANAAFTIEDDNAAGYEYKYQSVAISNDSKTHTHSIFVGKDQDETRFPGIYINMTGGTSKTSMFHFNTKTGAFIETIAGGSMKVESYSDEFWKVSQTLTNNNTGNTSFQFRIYPARATVFGTASNTAVGSVVVDQAQLSFNTDTPYTGQVITTTVARTGVVDPHELNLMQSQNFVIENMTLSAKGVMTIIAKDILKLADDERAVCPVKSDGALTAGISAAATSLTVDSGTELDYNDNTIVDNGEFNTDTDWTKGTGWSIANGVASCDGSQTGNTDISQDIEAQPNEIYMITYTISNYVAGNIFSNFLGSGGVGTVRSANGTFSEYVTAPADATGVIVWRGNVDFDGDIDDISVRRAAEYIRIGDEIILAPPANRAANVFSNLSRGQFNTTAAVHSTDDDVQSCKYFNAENVIDIIRDLLVNYANISDSYIPYTDWEAERDKWLTAMLPTALITEPTGVKKLIDELAEQAGTYVWWDSLAQEIPLRAIAPPGEIGGTLTDADNFIGDPVIKTLVDDRKSRVILYYKPRTPISFESAKDFDSAYGSISAEEEGADKYNDSRIKTIFARWIISDSIAATIASRTLLQFKAAPVRISYTIDAKDADNKTGDFVTINTRQIQNTDGSNDAKTCQILSIEEDTRKAPGTFFRCVAQVAQFSARYGRIMAAGATSVYSSATDDEKEEGCYIIAAGDTTFSDGGAGYQIP